MTSRGSAYARFRRALDTRNLTIIRAAAAELPHVDLGDALTVCVAIREAEPERFERAALRWLARFCVEHRGASIAGVRAAAGAFEAMPSDPAGALERLRRLCEARSLMGAERSSDPRRAKSLRGCSYCLTAKFQIVAPSEPMTQL